MLYWGSLRMENWVALLHSLIKTSKKEIHAIWLVLFICVSAYFNALCICVYAEEHVCGCMCICVHMYEEIRSHLGGHFLSTVVLVLLN